MQTPTFLTLEEQDTLVRYYLGLFSTAAKQYGMNLRIQLTAMTFFSRFYLKRSVMEYEPKLLLYVSPFPSD
jgi:cyclin H